MRYQHQFTTHKSSNIRFIQVITTILSIFAAEVPGFILLIFLSGSPCLPGIFTKLPVEIQSGMKIADNIPDFFTFRCRKEKWFGERMIFLPVRSEIEEKIV